MGKAGSFGGDALEDVVEKRVHDAHGFAGDTSVRVNLLQHLVDVDSIAFLSLSPSLFPMRSVLAPVLQCTWLPCSNI